MKKIKHPFVFVCIALLGLTACKKELSNNLIPEQKTAEAALNTSSHGATVTQSVFDVDIIGTPTPLPVPCANNGLGENIINIKGTVQVLSVVTVNGNNFHSVFKFTAKGVVAEGEITGDIYEGVGSNEWVTNGTFTDGKITMIHRNVFYAIGRFGAPTFKLLEVLRITVFADGTVTATVDKTEVSCD